MAAVTDRFAAFDAEALNVHVDFPIFQQLAMPLTSGRTRLPGLEILGTRILRLMEVLLHSGTKISGWRTAHQTSCRGRLTRMSIAVTMSDCKGDLRCQRHPPK